MANEVNHLNSECCGLPCMATGPIDGRISQAFFARLSDSIRPPHTGEERRNFVKELLLRAEEASLYKPGAA